MGGRSYHRLTTGEIFFFFGLIVFSMEMRNKSSPYILNNKCFEENKGDLPKKFRRASGILSTKSSLVNPNNKFLCGPLGFALDEEEGFCPEQ